MRKINRKRMYAVAFAVCIALVNMGSLLVSKADANDMSVEYHACTVNGWNSWVGSGVECKVADGEAMTRFEMLMKNDAGESVDSNIEYSVASEAGWSVISKGGEMASAAGKPIKAITINLTGDVANAYKVEYRACNSNGEWLAWASNGTVVGNIDGEAYLTAVQVKVVQTVTSNTNTQTQTINQTGDVSVVQTTPAPEQVTQTSGQETQSQGQTVGENGAPMPTMAPGQTPEPDMIEYEPTIAPEYKDEDTVTTGSQDAEVIQNQDTVTTGSQDAEVIQNQDTGIVGNQEEGTVSAQIIEDQTQVTTTTSSAAEALIAKAESQLGKGRESDNTTIYGVWWANRVSNSAFRDAKWCAMFLSWCANEAGVSEKTIGYFAACSYWQKWFIDNGKWQAKDGYTPVRGDILFLDYDGDGEANHNGIVKSISGNSITVIEGNVNDKVDNVTYELSNEQIIGYGKPDYDNNAANLEAQKQEEESTGASGLAGKILEKAFSQRGIREDSNGWTKYGQWYNDNIDSGGFATAHWCAMFVSWCADQVGVPRDVIKPYASCWYGLQDLKTMATYHEASSGYEPQPGDIFFYHFSSSGAGHTGLVEKVSEGQIFTIEGNTDDHVDARTYPLSNSKIKGYITPRY